MTSVRRMMDLHDRVSLITGGAGHLGLAMAESLAEMGSNIILLDVKEDMVCQAASRIGEEYDVTARAIVVDLEDETAIRSVPGHIGRDFACLDVLINNAALVSSSELVGWSVPFPEQSAETWRRALEINLTAVFLLTQGCYPLLRGSGRSSVINIGSIYGVVGPNPSLYEGTNMGNPAAYAASKGGVIQLTRWLATAMAPDVRVNSISPGGIHRGQPEAFRSKYESLTPLGRMGEEDDLRGAVVFFASDLSSYVTGQNLMVDGGWVAW